MAKFLDFQEHTASVADADGDEHPSVVHAAYVDKDTEQEVNTLGGPRKVSAGDVVVKTHREGVYDVHSADVWDGLPYYTGDAPQDATEHPTRDGRARKTEEVVE